jgi:NADH-quinone oxidoreductase subunit M
MFQMISHGVVSGALFLCVGVVYDQMHTREITRYGGLVKNMPNYAVVFMVFMLGSVGLPGTSGFVGEFLSLLGAYQTDKIVAVFATTGLVLGAAYMLILYRRVVFGEQVNKDAAVMPDLDKREIMIFAPLLLLVIWLGVQPGVVMEKISPSVEKLRGQYVQAIEMSKAAAAPADEAAVKEE